MMEYILEKTRIIMYWSNQWFYVNDIFDQITSLYDLCDKK